MLHFDKKFQKQYQQLRPSIRAIVDQRLAMFVDNPRNPRLSLHPLKGDFAGYYSINITGDIRAIFYRDAGMVVFILLGTHSQLY